MTKLIFPENFIWGAASSAYQIEGAAHEDGREDSIWDVFCRTPGKIQNGDTGDVACDHYHRWKEDVALMASLGIKSYRFSLAWPRISPRGTPNVQGIAFYDRLIDELLNQGIAPAITLYHWDLPQRLQEKGGWTSRDTVKAFTDYAAMAFDRYSDRVKLWMTHNEPAVVSLAGHRSGSHAPGIQDPEAAIIAAHHLLLSHGAALKQMRKQGGSKFQGKIGIVLNISAVHPENPSDPRDRAAAAYAISLGRNFYLDALFKSTYPQIIWDEYPVLKSVVWNGDLALINEPMDFLGINYYTKTVVHGMSNKGKISPQSIPAEPNPYSNMWRFYPEGLTEIVRCVWDYCRPKEIMITENGTALDDVLSTKGDVDDPRRIDYVREHLKALHVLIQDKIPITSYYLWSIMDNFEWNYGYQKRFGIVYVDYPSQKRIVKASGLWYQKLIQENALE